MKALIRWLKRRQQIFISYSEMDSPGGGYCSPWVMAAWNKYWLRERRRDQTRSY